MNFTENIFLALRSIRGNLLRTFLTFMIIAFGIMALVGILTAMQSMIAGLSSNFSSLGANTFNIIQSGSGVRGKGPRMKDNKTGDPISYRDAVDFKSRYDYTGATASISTLGLSSATVQHDGEKTGNNISVMGVDETYLQVAGFTLAAGREFSATEALEGANVAIVGVEITQRFFKNKPEKAIGQTISVQNRRATIVGVLEAKGSSNSFNGDRIVLMPLPTVRSEFGSQRASFNISCAVMQQLDFDEAIGAATGAMRQVRRIELGRDNDFEITRSDGLMSFVVDNTAKIQYATLFIGIITLLGAAIGLMNIMLVSVTERTREIGICKALGATRRNILTQFLVEAIVICQIGGLLGIVLGVLLGNVLSIFLHTGFIIPWVWMLLGIVLCLVVGLLSGLYPAMKAAELDPIEALRYE